MHAPDLPCPSTPCMPGTGPHNVPAAHGALPLPQGQVDGRGCMRPSPGNWQRCGRRQGARRACACGASSGCERDSCGDQHWHCSLSAGLACARVSLQDSGGGPGAGSFVAHLYLLLRVVCHARQGPHPPRVRALQPRFGNAGMGCVGAAAGGSQAGGLGPCRRCIARMEKQQPLNSVVPRYLLASVAFVDT